jgi:HSP20 family protein
MSALTRRERGDLTERFGRMDRLFDEWMRSLSMRRPFGVDWDWRGEELIRVDEYRDGNTEVIRAELPGVDPEKDVEITVNDGILRIRAERRIEEKTEDKGYLRHELRYGSLTRSLPLPDGVSSPTSRRATRTASSRSGFRCPSGSPRRSPRRSPSPRNEPVGWSGGYRRATPEKVGRLCSGAQRSRAQRRRYRPEPRCRPKTK